MTLVVSARLALLILGFALTACGEGAPNQAAPPPPAVTVAKPTKQQVVDYDEYVGRFITIDRRPFETALAQNRATLAQARANLAFAESDLARASQLVRDRTITEQTF